MSAALLLVALLAQPAGAAQPATAARPRTDEATQPATDQTAQSREAAQPDAEDRPAKGAAPEQAPAADSGQVINIDAQPAEDSDALVIIDEDPDESSTTEPPQQPFDSSRTWLRSEIVSRLMLDTHFNGTGEDVVEWWNLGKLRLDHKADRDLRAVADGWVRWGVTGEDPEPDHVFLLVNARDGKWTGEVELREAWLEWRIASFELRAGQRIFVWGKSELMAGADVLNPLDLRYDPLNLLESPKDAKVPVFALDALYGVGMADVQLVVLPFFTANRGFVVGRDLALGPPGSKLEAQIREISSIHPSVEDELQSVLFGTRLPEESPLQASVALRGNVTLGGIDLGATAYYGWDRTPRLHVDPDLLVLLASAEAIAVDPNLLVTDPQLRDASLGLQQKSIAGEELVRAVYRRMWRFALEAQGVVDDFVIRGDVGFSPGQTFYTTACKPTWKNSLTAALGVETMRGETWYVALTGVAQAIFRAPQYAPLLGIERQETDAGERRTAVLWGLSGSVRWLLEEQDVEVELNGIYLIEPGDRLGSLSIAYAGMEPHVFKAGGMLAEGPKGSIAHTYRHNDFVYVGYRSTW